MRRDSKPSILLCVLLLVLATQRDLTQVEATENLDTPTTSRFVRVTVEEELERGSVVRLVRGDGISIGGLTGSQNQYYLLCSVKRPSLQADVFGLAIIELNGPDGKTYTVKEVLYLRDLRQGEARYVIRPVSLPNSVAMHCSKPSYEGRLDVLSTHESSSATTQELESGATFSGASESWIGIRSVSVETLRLTVGSSSSDASSDGVYILVSASPKSAARTMIQYSTGFVVENSTGNYASGGRFESVAEGETAFVLVFLGHSSKSGLGLENCATPESAEDSKMLEHHQDNESSPTLKLRFFQTTYHSGW